MSERERSFLENGRIFIEQKMFLGETVKLSHYWILTNKRERTESGIAPGSTPFAITTKYSGKFLKRHRIVVKHRNKKCGE